MNKVTQTEERVIRVHTGFAGVIKGNESPPKYKHSSPSEFASIKWKNRDKHYISHRVRSAYALLLYEAASLQLPLHAPPPQKPASHDNLPGRHHIHEILGNGCKTRLRYLRMKKGNPVYVLQQIMQLISNYCYFRSHTLTCKKKS